MKNFNSIFSRVIKRPIIIFAVFSLAVILGFIIAKGGLVVTSLLFFLPFLLVIMILVTNNPRIGIIFALSLAMLVNGLSRYIDLPFGLSIDVILVLTLLMLFLKHWKNVGWEKSHTWLTWLMIIWMGYTLLELINPEAKSIEAWFYAMRGVALYPLLIVILALVSFNRFKDLEIFLQIWMVFSILASLKAIQQIVFGVDPWEQHWLNTSGGITHIIHGRLRAFSFYSDAAQFGAAQAHAFITGAILALNPTISGKKKWLYGIASILGLVGLFLSGARSALFIPATGFMVYLFLQRNFKVFVAGVMLSAMAFGFLKYSTIGNNIYQIARMRTALNPKDASLLVRIENQKKLATYLVSRPFGGGVGSAGNWGLRFSPHSFLAETPTDSWYVRIWAEMGIVGLTLHLIILFTIFYKSSLIIWEKLYKPEIIYPMLALISGYFGIMIASYANQILGQMPTGIIVYISWVFLLIAPRLQEEID